MKTLLPLQTLLLTVGILGLVALVSPLMLLTTGICGVAMWVWTKIYLKTAQTIKR